MTDLKYYAHPTAVLDQTSMIGSGTKIWHFCHIMKDSQIGEGCTLGQNVFVANDVKIGNNVKIQNNVSLFTGVTVEDDVFLGPSMVFTNVINPRSHVSRKEEFRKTLVRKGASIGANATILCGVTLGNFCFVGAGSVVTKDVPSYALIYGNPARHAGWMCQCGGRIRFSVSATTSECDICGESYKLDNSVNPAGEVSRI